MNIPFVLMAAPLGLSLMIPAISLAQEKSSGEIRVVITAGRKAEPETQTIIPVTVFTRAQIERSQVNSLPELLAQVPSLNVQTKGGFGKQSSIFLRGTNSNHVLVLVDGVRAGSATLGLTSFEYIPLDQVERIEVVRGPRSSLYGSEAIGGVIQIFTRKGSTTKKLTPKASIGAGSSSTYKANVGFSAGSVEDSWFNVNVATERSKGIDVLGSYPLYPSGTGYEKDRDGYRMNSITLNAGKRFAKDIETEFHVLKTQGDSDYDGSFENETDFKQQVVSGKISAPVHQRVKLSAQVGESRDWQKQYKDAVYTSLFETKRDNASLQADIRLGEKGSLSLGLDRLEDQVASNSTYAKTNRTTTGVFTAYQQQFGANSVDASLRRDDNEQYGGQTTGGLAFAHDFGNGLRATASYATAFKAPTFNDLYYPYDGNPNLKPEKGRNVELGLSQKLDSWDWGAQVFQNRISDLIEWQQVSPDDPYTWKPMNVAAARIRGVELSTSKKLGQWRVSANATLQQPDVTKGSNANKQLLYRPERLLNLNLDRRLGNQWEVGSTLHAESQRFTDPANVTTVAGFGTVDLRARYQINRDWVLSTKLGNILDKDYESSKGYHQQGRNAFVSLNYQPR
ncbi:TonB-dependent receptor domain-containing protein [Thiolinea disciformis]|uniref:TonB-dependent receptor domain-containing protein n=1 Tax=Thiolinea disciformis TaxID=125614 RepID=UPI00037D1441|nr:TonB-dependent receptor [Thiolinea disciformis]